MPLALVTGSAKRIGMMLAIHLANRGFDLLLHYNNSEKEVEDLIAIVQSIGVKAQSIKIDFADITQLNSIDLADYNMDLLINNAAVFENDTIANLEPANIVKNFQINCIAPMMLSKAMILNDSGSLNQKNIINILDSDTLRIPKNFTSYHVSKKSLEYFTEIAALQLAPIRVNAIALGYMLKNDRQRQEHFDAFAKSNPLQHQISGKELMQTIDYLINNQAVTGQIIKLDAGYSLYGPLRY